MVFSGNGHPPKDNPPSGPQKKPFLLGTPWGEALALGLFAAVITLYGLGGTSLIDNDETRFGLLARTMIETGDWVVPRWSHRPQGTKPPLFMWAIAGFSKITGEIDSWSARLPSALAGVGVVVLTYFLGRRFFPQPAPFLAALVMSANLAFYQSARIARTDMLLAFFVLLAVTLVLEGHARWGPRRFLLVVGGYAAAGLAVLTKGPVGLLLPGFILLSVTAARREWKKVPIAAHVAGLIVTAGIAGSWYFLYQEAIGAESARNFVLRENVLRYLSGFDHRRPVYYFVYTFAGDFMPWTPIFVLALAWAWVRRKAKTADYGATLLWFVVVFVFFSLSSSKRAAYILPLYPAAALMTGAFLSTAIAPVGKHLDRWRKAGVWTFRGLAVAAVGLAVGGPIGTAMRFRPFLVPAIAAAVLLCVLGAWMLRETFRSTLGRVTLVIPIGFLGIHLLVQPLAVPPLEQRKSPRPYAKEVADLVGPYHLVSYRFSKASLDFYAPPEMGEVYFIYDWAMLRYFFRYDQEPVYVVMSRKNYQKIRPEALVGSRLVRLDLKYRKDSLVVLTNNPYRPDGPARGNRPTTPARADGKDPAGPR